MTRAVLQDWVMQLPLMQQTVLLTAIRGPDGIEKYGPVKNVLRWYRRCVLLSAMDGAVLSNPYDTNGGSFTGPSIHADATFDWQWTHAMDRVVDQYMQKIDTLPMHFHLHLMHGAEIIGYKHPDLVISHWWLNSVYLRFVLHMHLEPEGGQEMNKRLSDNREEWAKRNDPATLA
jgi:hypothetical protein